jgi:lysophospholipase L1-like esterase
MLLIFGFGLYLNKAYAHIYSFMGAKNLKNPTTREIITLSSSSTYKLTYIALGDSLTAGVGATTQEKTYPYLLAKIIAEEKNAQVTLVNLAQPGATSLDILNQQILLVEKYHPDFITLGIGINDMHNKVTSNLFQQTIGSIVDSLSSTTKHINIITIPYLGSSSTFLPPYQYYFEYQTKQYNTLLRDAMIGKNVNIIDIYELTRYQALNNANYYSADGFHPSDSGFKLWSEILYDHLDY